MRAEKTYEKIALLNDKIKAHDVETVFISLFISLYFHSSVCPAGINLFPDSKSCRNYGTNDLQFNFWGTCCHVVTCHPLGDLQ